MLGITAAPQWTSTERGLELGDLRAFGYVLFLHIAIIFLSPCLGLFGVDKLIVLLVNTGSRVYRMCRWGSMSSRRALLRSMVRRVDLGILRCIRQEILFL